jgi:predicted amidohydrolase YtcJ
MGRELNVVRLPEPLRLMPFRTLIDAGVRVAFSSDFPAADLNPWAAVQAALTRHDGDGRPVLLDEAIDLTQALTAFTEHAAGVLGLADAGRLSAGARADLVWCDQDPYGVDVDQLSRIRTLATWRAGQLVHGGLAPTPTPATPSPHA